MGPNNLDHKFIPIIGISIGDLNGIGIEVTLKSLENPSLFSSLTPYHLCLCGGAKFLLKVT